MDYTEITELALSYADREDDEVTSRVDKFLLIVESRINKKLKVADMSARATIDTSLGDTDQEIYALPSDYGGLRSIKIATDPIRTLTYVNPEQLSNRKARGTSGVTGEKIYYNIVAKELHMYPFLNTGTMEITYYQRVDPLTIGNPNNWISDDNPECYTFGLLAEISAFTKDADAFLIWDKRFMEAVDDIDLDDDKQRWSGTPLQIHVG